jgi:hypothetical protein
MKTLRGYSHDLDAIEQMVKKKKVRAKALVKRYSEELNEAVGDKRKFDMNFLAMIERCYGKKEATKAQKAIGFEW